MPERAVTHADKHPRVYYSPKPQHAQTTERERQNTPWQKGTCADSFGVAFLGSVSHSLYPHAPDLLHWCVFIGIVTASVGFSDTPVIINGGQQYSAVLLCS